MFATSSGDDGERARGGPVGFIGLGLMGTPIARNLVRGGVSLVAWNRTRAKAEPLRASGATVAPDAAAVFAQCDTVILMLADETATDDVLARADPARFAALVRGRLVVSMGTVADGYSAALAADIAAAGGRYVEAPVSGSRGPAEAGQLVAMVAGDPADCAYVREVLAPTCSTIVDCGPVPTALLMKFAVNVFLITTVTGLAEAFHFAEQHGLDAAAVRTILDAGQMASTISRAKTAKVVAADFSPQAALPDVFKNTRLIHEAATARGVALPLLAACLPLYAEAIAAAGSDADMVAVIEALRGRTARRAV